MTTGSDMHSPLVKFPDRRILLAPRYFGSIDYYASMAAFGSAVVDTSMHFDKRRKETHRCLIADTRGELMLTVPIEKPSGRGWADVKVSAHGAWWNVHRVALESAYGRTPFFEFYIDRFLPFLRERIPGQGEGVIALDGAIDAVVRDILLIDSPVSYSAVRNVGSDDCDCRQGEMPVSCTMPYYQVRAAKLGFISGLSILDLIFNLGPESPEYLRSAIYG